MIKTIAAKELTTPFRIAIVISRFNIEITERLLAGAIKRLTELNIPEENVVIYWVPGAVEIPVTAQRLAQTETYEVIIVLGAVIRGDTDHYDAVCQQVNIGCQQVAIQNGIPVIFEVLMTENEEQAMERAGGAHGNKGSEAVDAAFDMVSVLRQI